MKRRLRPALEIVSAIGSLGFDLQHHAEPDISEAVRVLRTVNPEMFDWLVRILQPAAVRAGGVSRDPLAHILTAADRYVEDFAGAWQRINQISATTAPLEPRQLSEGEQGRLRTAFCAGAKYMAVRAGGVPPENIIATASHPDGLHYGAFDTCDHSDCQLVRAALADRVGARDWQPIETAPKTSRHILVWTPGNQCTNLVVWREDDRPSCWVHAFGGNELCDEPTHWRPLAAPPQAEGSPRAPHAQERKTP